MVSIPLQKGDTVFEMATLLSGLYRIVNDVILRQKAHGHPCQAFYIAMLTSLTYEEYLARVGQVEVVIPHRKDNPASGRREILYCRQHGWIRDVPDPISSRGRPPSFRNCLPAREGDDGR
jgi:hypothetical protein